MYPQTPTPANPTPPTPTDYLDQIAPKPAKSPLGFSGKTILMTGIAAVVLLVAVMAMGAFSGGIKPTERLAARLTATASTAGSATNNLKSTALRALNSDLKLYLTNTIRDIGPILVKDDVKIDNLDKRVVAKESNEKMLARLEDARLNVVYDRTYAREMAYQLDTILTLMNQIYRSTSRSQLKTFLKDSSANLEPIQKQFADFNMAAD